MKFGIFKKFKKLTCWPPLVFGYIPQFWWFSGVLDPEDVIFAKRPVITGDRPCLLKTLKSFKWFFFKFFHLWPAPNASTRSNFVEIIHWPKKQSARKQFQHFWFLVTNFKQRSDNKKSAKFNPRILPEMHGKKFLEKSTTSWSYRVSFSLTKTAMGL